jgi:hypothetical protein
MRIVEMGYAPKVVESRLLAAPFGAIDEIPPSSRCF